MLIVVQAVLPGQVVDVAIGIVDHAAVVSRRAHAAEIPAQALIRKAVVPLVGEADADFSISRGPEGSGWILRETLVPDRPRKTDDARN